MANDKHITGKLRQVFRIILNLDVVTKQNVNNKTSSPTIILINIFINIKVYVFKTNKQTKQRKEMGKKMKYTADYIQEKFDGIETTVMRERCSKFASKTHFKILN